MLPFTIHHLDQTTSTNDYAVHWVKKERPQEGTVVSATTQTSGKGRKQRDWYSGSGLNLTFSVIVYPRFLAVEKQFYLSIISSLAIAQILEKKATGISIKWPNDIFLKSDKIAGILIENVIQGTQLNTSVVGFGVNVNESPMPDSIAATSLLQETGTKFDLSILLEEMVTRFLTLYDSLRKGYSAQMKEEYRSRLYFGNKMSVFTKGGIKIKARVQGVDDLGNLLLITSDGSEIKGNMDELTWEYFI